MLSCKNIADIMAKLEQVTDYEQAADLMRRYEIGESQIFDISGNAILFAENRQIEGKIVNALVRNNCAGCWEFCRVVY